MEGILLYIITALCVVLLVVVVVLITQISNLKKEVWENAQQDSITQQNVQNGLQASLTQAVNSSAVDIYDKINTNMRDSYAQINQSLTTGYTQINQAFDTKLATSFESINAGLGQLQKNIGQMQSMASGIDDLRKVLSNIKTRGMLGEIQLGNLLEQVLAPTQYETNVETIPNTGRRVEFAIKLPGGEDGNPVYLPIDSKFPGDLYSHLIDAVNASDDQTIELLKKQLIQRFKDEAKDIKNKYIKAPYTTDFGIMFLPVEGLYVEAVNCGMIETLQQEYNVVIAGPSTMSALLNAILMGFKSLAIQKNSDKVWQVLNDVKNEFETFEESLNKVQTSFNAASNNLEALVGTRTRAINRKLRNVQSLEDKDGDGSIDIE